ncbi:hypothetical protein [Neobacillus mesonae]|nr:hypothetical protein [Neobacillus mesonae]
MFERIGGMMKEFRGISREVRGNPKEIRGMNPTFGGIIKKRQGWL